MAYPETNTPKRDPFGDAKRDPTGTDPNAQNSFWNWVVGLAVVALVAFFIFNSMSGAPRTLNNTTTSQPVAPTASPPAAPAAPTNP